MESWLEPLHDAETMRAVDAWAIDERGVPSLDLMEAAGRAVAGAAEEVTGHGPARVVCGKGNNGGDGLVVARHLAEAGHEVHVLLLSPAGELSPDAAANLERFGGSVERFTPDALAGSGVGVDAIFGTGFEGEPRDPAASAITAMGGCGAPVVAADIPSGVDASTGEAGGVAVEATVTVTFHAPKLGHWIAPGKRHAGELRIAPIGIPAGAPGGAPGGLIDPSVLRLLERRGPDSTKFSSGTVLVAGGSRGLTGSVCLAAGAAARAGAGYVTVAVPAELEDIFEVKLTEQMSIGCPSADGAMGPDALDAILEAADRRKAVVLGPGLGRAEATKELVRQLAPRVGSPLVIDADGLNALAGELELLADRRHPTVLTPHAGELGRLLDIEPDAVGERRLAAARDAASRSGAIAVLKGDDTIIASPDEGVIVNGLSSPALATAGTGDVLSGMIAALIARGMEVRPAVAAAVHAHTRAGRAAAQSVSAAESVVAGDVIDAIPGALSPDDRLGA
jgi:NAD(P)H-hydrate epimerase